MTQSGTTKEGGQAVILFKILGKDGAPIHGGTGQWKLPTETVPGEWMEYQGDLRICQSGYHGVTNVAPWIKVIPNLAVYPLEVDLAAGADFDGTAKGCFRRVRLHPEITWDWPWLPLYPDVRLLLAVRDRVKDPEADIARANLTEANLPWANLARANLSGANLSGANLARANLTEANLTEANLAWADLSGANLPGANLARANLSGANLARANLSGAYCPHDPPPGWASDENGYLVKEAKS